MPATLHWALTVLLVLLAGACLVDRQLRRACLAFVAFSLTMALAWWWLEAPWLALAEALLGALMTGTALLQALGLPGTPPRLPLRDAALRHRNEAPARWLGAMAWLTLTAGAIGWLFGADALAPSQTSRAALVPASLLVMAFGLGAFAHHRHLLRRLLAFNVLGSGVFLLLVGLAGTSPEVQGLILVGLVVALVGSRLGARLLGRLYALEGRVTLDAPEPGAGG